MILGFMLWCYVNPLCLLYSNKMVIKMILVQSKFIL